MAPVVSATLARTNRTIPPIDDAPRARAAAIATGAITNARTARSRLPMFLMRYLLAIVRSFRCGAFGWKDENGSGGDTPTRRRATSFPHCLDATRANRSLVFSGRGTASRRRREGLEPRPGELPAPLARGRRSSAAGEGR